MLRPIQSRWFQAVFAFTLATAFLAFGMHGQTGPSTPPAAPAAAPAATNGTQPAATAAVATIHARTNLVVVDVVVTDSKKNPVHGLQKSDFTLMEDGKLQVVRNFEEHSSSPAAEQIEPAPKLPAGLFTNKSAAPANGPVNVLLLDYLNTPVTAQANAKKQLIEFLDKAPAGTRIAIFGMTTHLYMLQGFTSDMAVLKAALTSKKGTPQVSDILTDAVNSGPMGTTAFSDAAAQYPDVTQEMQDDMARVDAQITSEEQNDRMLYTLNSFDQLARYLVGIPGRKNVIWYSASFPLDVEPNVKEADPNDSVVRNDEAVRKTDNLLTRAQVAVYPVDARGVQTDPNFSVTNQLSGGAADATASMEFQTQRANEHGTMEAMAEDTGGEAFYNTNGLTQAVTKAVEEGSNYYTLTYSPANTQWDERFRTIKVKVAEPERAANLSQWLLCHRPQRPEPGERAGGGHGPGPDEHHVGGHDARRPGPGGDPVQGENSPREYATGGDGTAEQRVQSRSQGKDRGAVQAVLQWTWCRTRTQSTAACGPTATTTARSRSGPSSTTPMETSSSPRATACIGC